MALAIVLGFMNPCATYGADPKGEAHINKHGHSAKVAKTHEHVKESTEDVAKERANQQQVDIRITNAVKNSVLFHFLLDTKIETLDGVVTLTGTAANNEEKELNSKLATKISGVKKVVNMMDVSSSMVTSN